MPLILQMLPAALMIIGFFIAAVISERSLLGIDETTQGRLIKGLAPLSSTMDLPVGLRRAQRASVAVISVGIAMGCVVSYFV